MSEEMEISAIPPSSLPRIPQSVIRSSQGVARNPFISSIQATPSRRSVSAASGQSDGFLEVNIAGNGGYLPSSPLQQCRYSTQLFNTIPDSAIKLPSGGSGPSFQETPIKKRLGVTLVHSHPKPTSGNDKENGVNLNKQAEVGRVAGKKLEDSIYKSLGWDDTDDFDELA
jgi:DNA replication regulator SLD3